MMFCEEFFKYFYVTDLFQKLHFNYSFFFLLRPAPEIKV